MPVMVWKQEWSTILLSEQSTVETKRATRLTLSPLHHKVSSTFNIMHCTGADTVKILQLFKEGG
jgi:hypothetical protein